MHLFENLVSRARLSCETIENPPCCLPNSPFTVTYMRISLIRTKLQDQQLVTSVRNTAVTHITSTDDHDATTLSIYLSPPKNWKLRSTCAQVSEFCQDEGEGPVLAFSLQSFGIPGPRQRRDQEGALGGTLYTTVWTRTTVYKLTFSFLNFNRPVVDDDWIPSPR